MNNNTRYNNSRTYKIEIRSEVFKSLKQISFFMKDSVLDSFRENQDDILTETFLRFWKSCWNSKMTYSHFSGGEQEKNNILSFESRETFKAEIVTPKIRQGEYVGDDVSIKNLPSTTGLLDFKYSNGVLNVTIVSLSLEQTNEKYDLSATKVEEGNIEKFANFLERDYEKIKKLFEEMSLIDVLESLFDTLYSRSICNVRGMHAKMLYKVYSNALLYFPNFTKVSLKQQAHTMRRAFKLGSKIANSPDIHCFAQGMYTAISEKQLNDIVYKYDDACQTFLTFKKIKDYFFDDSTKVKFTTYSARKFRTSFAPSTLWELLTK